MNNKQFLFNSFRDIYGQDPEGIFFAPARVNLIGEHIDYNGGLVMPCAIANGTYLAIRRTNDGVLKFRSLNFPKEVFQVQYKGLGFEKSGNIWANYPLGVIDYFIREGKALSGMELLFYGNIPNGGGLSSSASIEVVTAFALNKLYCLKKNPIEIVKISQNVENNFVGVNCGIMDQFAVGMGKKAHAIVLNCQTLEYHYTPFELTNEKLLIINTNKERKLADSKYNERRATCEQALSIFNKKENFPDLCSVSLEYFKNNEHLLTDEQKKRVKHVITENQRVKSSFEALKNGDIHSFGQLMNASHQSLMEDYQVTGEELDTVYLESVDFEGVVGVRMTGAGFGGCAIALVKTDKVESYKKHIVEAYTKKIGYSPSIYEVEIADAVKEI